MPDITLSIPEEVYIGNKLGGCRGILCNDEEKGMGEILYDTSSLINVYKQRIGIIAAVALNRFITKMFEWVV